MSKTRLASLYLPGSIPAAVHALRPSPDTPKWVIDDLHHAGRLVVEDSLEADSIRTIIRCGLPKVMWARYAKLERTRRDNYAKASQPPLLAPLANILGQARRFGPEARLTARQRRTRASAIEEHAEKLLALLKPMEDVDCYPEWNVVGYGRGSHILATALSELADGARKWAKPRGGYVPKPTLSTADRTYFVKTSARLFQYRYDNPCPGLIASLAKAFFPARTLDRKEVEGLIRS